MSNTWWLIVLESYLQSAISHPVIRQAKKGKVSCLPHRLSEGKKWSLFVSTCKLQHSCVIYHSITSKQQWTDYNIEWAAQCECQNCRQQVHSQSELTYRQKERYRLFLSTKMLNKHFFTYELIARDANINIGTNYASVYQMPTSHLVSLYARQEQNYFTQ